MFFETKNHSASLTLSPICSLALVLIAFMIISLPAGASTTGSVGSASVSKGKTSLEARIGYSDAENSSSQDERFRNRVQIDHGFTDYYAGRIVISQDRRKGDNLEHDAIKVENRFYLMNKDDYGFDFGLRAAYSHKDGDKKPNALEFGLYALASLDVYEVRVNQIFSHEVGADAEDGIGGEPRLQVTRPIIQGHRFGLESFHDFGNFSDDSEYSDQSHTFGPVFKGKISETMKYETGYRVGISDSAPDHSFKFFLSHTF